MDGIATYNKKRDFTRTPEPRGRVAASSKGAGKYLIQKHDASHVHYDFRLEIGGVLCSWAIPKGPSLDPHQKRLAVRTEDHPMAYGDFEGTIPKGEYGGGTVMLWDRGTWKPDGNPREGLRKGSLKFELMGERLKGSFVLTRLRSRGREKRENWLLIKRSDATAHEGGADDVVRDHEDSVVSGRTMNEIATARGKQWHSNRKQQASEELPEEKAVAAPKHAIRKIEVAKLKGSRKARLPQKFSPQLATLVEDPPDDKGWISEIKFDGYRMVVRIDDGAVKIFSRNGLPWEKKLPTVAASLAKLAVKQAWLDGEIVALDDNGRSNFSKLKDILGGEGKSEIYFFLFDVMYLDGYDVTGCRQQDRKALLEYILGESPPPYLKYSDHVEGFPERIRQRACEMHLEGIIAKQADAPYRQQRSKSWLKLKCIQREEFIVVGYTDPQGTREGFGALHMGYYDKNGDLHYAGGVGTGFNVKTLKAIHKKLQEQTRRIPPSILIHGEPPPKKMHWVKPTLVAETQYIDWTDGGSIRHAVFMGLRDDKTPSDVVREPPTEPKSRFTGSGTVVTAASPKAGKAHPKSKKTPRPEVASVIDNRRAKGEAVELTHPDKKLWPADKLTKRDLADYWQRAGEYALPHIAGRPLALVRCPDGIDGEKFFQKKISPGFPSQIMDIKVGGDQVMAIRDSDGLQALAQMAAIEIHPWGSTVDDIEKPTLIVLDLDPDQGLDFDDVVGAAHDVRDALDTAGLKSFCKTTGGKGLHVVVPLRPELGWDEVKAFAKSVAAGFAKMEPKRFTDDLSKKSRRGRIFIDYLRNGRGATGKSVV